MHGSLNAARAPQSMGNGESFWDAFTACHERYLDPLRPDARRLFRLALGEAALAYARTKRLPKGCRRDVRKCFGELLALPGVATRHLLAKLVANAHAQLEFLA